MAVEVVLNVGPAGAGPPPTPTATPASASPSRATPTRFHTSRGLRHAAARGSSCSAVNRPPDVQPTCSRTQVGGLFWLRTISTMVVDVAGPTPRMWLSQGPAPDAWLVDRPEGEEGPRRTAPLGLMAFGAAGLAKFSDATLIACGDVPDCSDQSGVALGAQAPRSGSRGSSARRSTTSSRGSSKSRAPSAGYRFDSYTNVHILNMSGLGGVPVGPCGFTGRAA